MLEKLEWKLFPAATCMSFIQVIYQILNIVDKAIDTDFLTLLLERSELYLNYTSCSVFGVSIH